MYNEEIYQKMKAEFGPILMPAVTDIISTLYDIKYQAAKNTDALSEYDYERDWWLEKHRELVKIEDEQLCQE
jgi:hypothetical protein